MKLFEFEAIAAGIKTLVVITELILQRDAIEFMARADREGVIIVAPNTPGVINPEKRMGHAGAIIMENTGSANSKIEAFSRAGVPVADKPSDIAKLLNL